MAILNIPCLKKRNIIRCFLTLGWTIIALIVIAASGMMVYEDIKYLLWLVTLIMIVLIVLYSNSTPPVLSKKEEDRTVLALAISFNFLLIVFLATNI